MAKPDFSLHVWADPEGRREWANAMRRIGRQRWFRVESSRRELPDDVVIRLGTTEDGRLICTGLMVGALTEPAAEVTSADLRQIPLAAVLTEIAGWLRNKSRGLAEAVTKHYALQLVSPHARPVGVPRRPGRRGRPDSHYREVAETYKAALQSEARRAPVREVMKAYGVQEATAHRWLNKAREKNYLPQRPARRGTPRPGRTTYRKGTDRG